MVAYRKQNGDGTTNWDWHKITENMIMVLAITILTTGFSWFLGIRDMKKDIKDLKQLTYLTCETVWKHIHPDEPNPFIDLREKDVK